jgi:hypothetical protein
MANAEPRAAFGTAVAEHIPLPILERVAGDARSSPSDEARAHALTAPARFLPQDVYPQGLDAASKLNDTHQARVHRTLAPHLPKACHEKALELARGRKPEKDRANALTGLSPELRTDNLARKALTAARTIGDSDGRTSTIAALNVGRSSEDLQRAKLTRSAKYPTRSRVPPSWGPCDAKFAQRPG